MLLNKFEKAASKMSFDDEELRPGELKKPKNRKIVQMLKDNPFIDEWRFPVNLWQDKCFIGQDSYLPTSLNKLTQNDMDKIENGDFRPYLTDANHLRIYLTDNEKLRERLYNIKGKALNLLFYIMFNLKDGSHYIDLNQQIVCSKLGFKSKQTFYNHIKTLERHNIIRKADNGRCYVNIQLFFRGSRGYSFPELCYSSKEGGFNEMQEVIKRTARKQFKPLSKKGE